LAICSVFDFSQPGAIACGEGAMIVTDDEETPMPSAGIAAAAGGTHVCFRDYGRAL